MSEHSHHIISSAVVSVLPGRQDDVVAALAALPATEVSAVKGNKIVVILEGGSRSDVGSRLATIALMDGIVAANMVFEHVDYEGEARL
jgi:nitrate reductase NapD